MSTAAWNKQLSTSADTVFTASDYQDDRTDLSLTFVADGSFWFFTDTWADTVSNAANAGTTGRATKFTAGTYSFKLADNEILKFRSVAGTVNFEGAVTKL